MLGHKWHCKTAIGYPKVKGRDYVTWSRKWRWRHSDVTKNWQKLTKYDNFCCLLAISPKLMTREVFWWKTAIVHLRVVRYDYVTWSRTWRWRHSSGRKIDKNWEKLTKYDNFCCLLAISPKLMTREVFWWKTAIVHLRVVRYDHVTWSRTWRWRHSNGRKIDKNWQNMTIFAVYWLYLLN